MNADQILSIKLTEPERLFEDRYGLPAQFKALAKIWHPDLCRDSRASAVFAHIKALFDSAEKKAAAGEWSPVGKKVFECKDGATRTIRYKISHRFELGETIYSGKVLAYLIDPAYGDLFGYAGSTIKSLRFSGPAMKAEMEKYLPLEIASFETKSGICVKVFQKTEDVVMLRDLLDLKTRIEPVHAAWILNGIYNICCYLQWEGLMHGGITTESVFISPKHHSVMLYGGWWYAAKIGGRIRALPKAVMDICPPDIVREKSASARVDLSAVRAIGREILGDRRGMALTRSKDIHSDIVQFLRLPAGENAQKEYQSWGNVLKSVFGDRRFVEMPVNLGDIYR